MQIRDAAARANAGAWLGPGTRPGSLGEHKACDAPCPKPAARPTLAARRRAQLDLTACDRWGTRRVGRARRGGVGLSNGAPGQSQRAQRAQRASPEAGSVPYTAAHGSASPSHRLRWVGSATRRPGAAVRCEAVVMGSSHVVEALRQRRARAARAAHVQESATPTLGRVARACWNRRAAGATLHHPWSPYATGTGPLRRPKALGRHDEPESPERRGARARCWYL